jgi:hypothetical protein
MSNHWAAFCTLLILSSADLRHVEARGLDDLALNTAIDALLSAADTNMSEDPSCKADLSQPHKMRVSEGLARLLSRAASERRQISFVVECFDRADWPRKAGQEYCKIYITDSEHTGLVFLMDWSSKSVVPGSVECSN